MSTLRFSMDAKHFEQALFGLVARRGEKWRVLWGGGGGGEKWLVLSPPPPPPSVLASPREVARRVQNILKTDLFGNVDVAIIM